MKLPSASLIFHFRVSPVWRQYAKLLMLYVWNHLVNCTQFCVRSTNCAITISNCIGVNGDSGIWSILNWYSPPNSFLCHSDITFDRLCLASQHTWNEFLCPLGITLILQAIRLLKYLKLLSMACCHLFWNAVGHLNKTGLEKNGHLFWNARWASE